MHLLSLSLLSSQFFAGMLGSDIWIATGIALVWKPLKIAGYLLPAVASPVEKTSWSLDEFQAVLFSVLAYFFS